MTSNVNDPKFDDRKATWALNASTDFQAEQTLKTLESSTKELTTAVKNAVNSLEIGLVSLSSTTEKTASDLKGACSAVKILTEEMTKTSQQITKFVSGVNNTFGIALGIPPSLSPISPDASIDLHNAPVQTSQRVIEPSTFQSLMDNFLSNLKSMVSSGFKGVVNDVVAAAHQTLLKQILSLAEVKELDVGDENILKDCSIILENPSKFLEKQIKFWKEQNSQIELPKDCSAAAIETWKTENPGKELFKDFESIHSPLKYAVNHVWQKLNKYHLFIGTYRDTLKPYQSEELNKNKNNGASPTTSNNTFNSELKQFCERWNLKHISPNLTKSVTCSDSFDSVNGISVIEEDTPAPITGAISNLSRNHTTSDVTSETSDAMIQLANRTIQFSTMACVDYFFGRVPENQTDQESIKNSYRKIMKENVTTEAVRKAFTSKYKGLSYYLIQIPYLLVYKLIAPIVSHTSGALQKDIERVLNNEIDLVDVTAKKLTEVSNYFGTIEDARREYLKPGHGQGSLDAFLVAKAQKRQFGNHFSEKELFEHLEGFIVKNYVKRPNLSIRKFRIPLLTNLAERIVWATQKKMLHTYLKRSTILKTLLEQGTNSIKYGQLGIKTFLRDKLAEVITLITESKKSHTYTEKNSESTDTIHKTHLTTIHLEQIVNQLSNKTLRFIDIVACNNNDQELRKLDQKIISTVQEIFQTFNINLFSTQQSLEDAASNMILMSLEALVNNKDNRGQEQLKNFLNILMMNFEPTDSTNNTTESNNQKYFDSVTMLDAELKQLISQLSDLAVDDAFEEKVKNYSENKHESVKKFAEETKTLIENLTRELHVNINEIKRLYEIKDSSEATPDSNLFDHTKDQLSIITSSITTFMEKVILNNTRAAKECYKDVAGDYYNLIYEIVGSHGLTNFQQRLGLIAAENEKMEIIKNAKESLSSIEDLISQLSIKNTVQNLETFCEAFMHKLPSVLQKHLYGDKTLSKKRTFFEEKLSQVKYIKNANELELKKQSLFSNIQTIIPKLNSNLTSWQETNERLNLLKGIQDSMTELNKIPPTNSQKSPYAVTQRKNKIAEINQKINQLKTLNPENEFNSYLQDLQKLFSNSDAATTQIMSISKDIRKDIEEHKLALTKIQKLVTKNIATVDQLNEGIIPLNNKSSDDPFAQFSRQLKTNLAAIQKGLSSTNKSETPLIINQDFLNNCASLIELIEAQIAENALAIDNYKSALKEVCLEITKDLQSMKMKSEQVVQNNCATLHSILDKITQLSTHLRVKGFISIGQSYLMEIFEPPAKDYMRNVINTKLKTLVNALGMPYHYKQLALELIFLPIAKKEKGID